MKHAQLIAVVMAAMLASACASKQDKAAPTAKAPAAAQETVQGEIVGKPAPGSKFSKLKIGMTLAQAVKLIGPPTKQWQHPTGKASIPFYFGPDRWVLKYSYKREGVLTFNYGGDQLLTRVEVNKAE
ncbi:MAG: outer membrane protein assembly factor BamE [Gammaproteobacteria bacterium]|nr:outer membrane protein assembly factor BamE [Gammaproteobacteria bacterium]MBU1967939.1 outer membrane protein assembly factor BamE [Gammaproteobacteria bacterium]